MSITQALIMAAGEAKRMRPLTDNLPKPLIEIGGKPILTRIIDNLIDVGVNRVVINGYHAIQPLKDYIQKIKTIYPSCEFILSEETELLETGGGTVQALQYLDSTQPFFMINGDAYWVNSQNGNTLEQLSSEWQKGTYDLLLLMQSTTSMDFTEAVGDYDIDNGMATRSRGQDGSYMFTGVRICHPKILNGHQATRFSFLNIMDEIENNNRLGGLHHQGEWYHISTPADVDDVNANLFGDV